MNNKNASTEHLPHYLGEVLFFLVQQTETEG